MGKEIVLKGSYDVTNPEQMVKMANVLKNYIVKNKLYTAISNKNYVHVEGWTFAGGLMGLFPIVVSVQDQSKTGEIKYMATVEIKSLKDEHVVARGFAVCSTKENKKKSFDEYAVLSMAQTRAIGKAYRNLIGWVIKLAGYEGTPSEEMKGLGEKVDMPPPVAGPEGEPVYLCQKCDAPIDGIVAQYSKKVFGKMYCRSCQKDVKSKNAR